jgi:deferrochelatase/peroxidase EfeB
LLHRAARELLPEIVWALDNFPDEIGESIWTAAGQRLFRQLKWLTDTKENLPAVRVPPPLPKDTPKYPTESIQGGILRPYDGVTDGCLCLLSLDNLAAAKSLLESVKPTTDDIEVTPDLPLVNIAFTPNGLRACGLENNQIDWFPIEFRQGMEARAGLLGDVRGNHPRRWKLPTLNWPEAIDNPDWKPTDDRVSIAFDAVHVMIQIRIAGAAGYRAIGDSSRKIIAQTFHKLLDTLKGVRPLSVQWMSRMQSVGQVVDHFGFTDGQSQPQFIFDAKKIAYPNQVHLGEVLVGYDNAAESAADQEVNKSEERRKLLGDGSFLVVRKLRQNVEVLRRAVDRIVVADSGNASPLSADKVMASMMGRWTANSSNGLGGKPLIPPEANDPNGFNYLYDVKGEVCPIGAHIRRANPRTFPTPDPLQPPGERPPRLMRRSLPYGPPVSARGNDIDRGLIFMAYNACIGEQFEVIQRWLTGGNSSSGLSSATCPFLGVSETGRTRFFRFEHAERTIRMPLDGENDLGTEPDPIVQLQWGLYLFTPSLTALKFMQEVASKASIQIEWSADEGAKHISQLRLIEQEFDADVAAQAWKAALEDPDSVANYHSASIWAAIRRDYGGVLRIPYGILVAERALVDEVLSNQEGRYSVGGYQKRLNETIGPIFLGLDDGADGEYQLQSAICNDEIMKLDFTMGFNPAREAANAAIDEFINDAIWLAKLNEVDRWELNIDCREIIDRTLARLCEAWFGLVSNEAGPFLAGGFDWNWRTGEPALYPGHFTAPSRYTFQPQPGDPSKQLAVLHGTTLRANMLAFLTANQNTISAPITRAVLDKFGATDLTARTIVGAMMGFLPSTDGNLRKVFNEWCRDGSLWSLRAKVSPQSLKDWPTASALLAGPMRNTIQLRPVPEQIWRTTVSLHSLGTDPDCQVLLRPGEKVILSLVSATQQDLADGNPPDVFRIFGGKRNAKPDQPTHACPGYRSAIGAMIGILSAVLDRSEALRPGPAAGVLTYEGKIERTKSISPAWVLPEEVKTGNKGTLLAFGDSWLSIKDPVFNYDLLRAFREIGFDTTYFTQHAHPKQRLEEMHAVSPANNNSIYGLIRSLVLQSANNSKPLPIAILVDGGGNDITHSSSSTDSFIEGFSNGATFDEAGFRKKCEQHGIGSPLDDMILPKSSAQSIDSAKLDSFLKRMGGYLVKILLQLTEASSSPSNGSPMIPILVFAYDFPIPDGFPTIPSRCPSLKPCFDRKGYSVAEGTEIMRELICRLNLEYERVISTLSSASTKIKFLRLTGTLEKQPDFDQGYKIYWNNELHPSKKGYAVLANCIASNF